MTGSAGFAPGIGDLFHRFVDRRMRAAGGPGNGSQFLFELEGHLAPDALQERLDRLGAAGDPLGMGLRGRPTRWLPVGPPPAVEALEARDAEALFRAEWPRPLPPLDTPSLRIGVAPGELTSLVLLRWCHPLMDAPGCDRLVELLDGADPARFRLLDEPESLVRRAGARGPSAWRALHGLFLRGLLASLRGRPFQCPVDASPPTVHLRSFSREQTAAVDARARALAGALEVNHFFLGAALGAAAEVLEAPPGATLAVPCPIDLRPPAWRGPVFSNYATTLLLRVPVDALGAVEPATAAVKERFRRGLARREEVAVALLMRLLARLPGGLGERLFGGVRGRDPSSLVYSSVDLKAGRSGRLFGLPVRRAFVASHIPSPPGLCVMISRCAGRLSVAVPDHGSGRGGALLDAVGRRLLGE